MLYDYSKLQGRIIEKFGTQADFARAIGRSQPTVSRKMNGKTEWTQKDMAKICDVLDIQDWDMSAYFFALKVQRC